MTITIRDIARLSNTSIAAVSRVLNNRGGVAIEKQERIRELVRELNYSPNRNARSLVRQRTHLLGLIVSDLANPRYVSFIQSVEDLGRAQEYQILIADSQMNLQREIENVDIMLEHRAEGLLIFPVAEYSRGHSADHFLSLRLRRMPFLLFGDVEGGAFDAIRMDEEGAGYMAGKHLTDLGHMRLAIAGCIGDSATVLARWAGLRRAAAENGAVVLFDDAGVDSKGFPFTGDLADFWRERLTASSRPTGIFAINDTTAISFYYACREWGLAIPGDISITSMDNDPYTAYLPPPLTTEDPNIEERARAGMEMLFERIANPEAPPVVREMYYTLIPRGSTGPAPKG